MIDQIVSQNFGFWSKGGALTRLKIVEREGECVCVNRGDRSITWEPTYLGSYPMGME